MAQFHQLRTATHSSASGSSSLKRLLGRMSRCSLVAHQRLPVGLPTHSFGNHSAAGVCLSLKTHVIAVPKRRQRSPGSKSPGRCSFQGVGTRRRSDRFFPFRMIRNCTLPANGDKRETVAFFPPSSGVMCCFLFRSSSLYAIHLRCGLSNRSG
jgi:hypothetical protein